MPLPSRPRKKKEKEKNRKSAYLEMRRYRAHPITRGQATLVVDIIRELRLLSEPESSTPTPMASGPTLGAT